MLRNRCARLASFAVLLAACAPSPRRPTSMSSTGHVGIAPADAEVWSFTLDVTARPSDGALGCDFDVDGRAVPAERRADAFGANLSLSPGTHRVTAVCKAAADGVWRSDPATYVVMLRDEPVARAVARAGEGALLLDGSSSAVAAHSHSPIVRYEWSLRTGLAGPEQPLGRGATLRVVPPGAPGEYTYVLAVTDAAGATARAGAALDVDVATPDWTASGVVYGIHPPLFGDPPLRAVRAALPSLASLGVAALWLSPVFDAPPDDYGYAVTDYLRVRPSFGTDQDLRDLVQDAHRLGLRVVLDFVPNHTAVEHPYFRQAEALGARSHYYGFYERDANGAAVHYFDWVGLPNLAYTNPEVRSFTTAVAERWLFDADIDGYRVDAVWGVRRRAPAGFLEGWVADLRRLAPRAFLLAEATARDGFYTSAGFSAVYDWTEELGHAAWGDVFDAPDGIARRLDRALRDTDATQQARGRVFRFLNNNDTGPRFVTRHGVALTRVATVALLTLPGLPSLYCFDEGGAEYEPYRARGAVPRAPHPELVPFHRELIRLRRTVPALHGDGFEPLRVGATDEAYVYVRRGTTRADAVLVALNFGEKPVTLRLDAQATLGRPKPLFASAGAELHSGVIRLEPFGYLIIGPG